MVFSHLLWPIRLDKPICGHFSFAFGVDLVFAQFCPVTFSERLQDVGRCFGDVDHVFLSGCFDASGGVHGVPEELEAGFVTAQNASLPFVCLSAGAS